MENPKQQLIDSIKGANNVLVTVSSSPTVDQLSAAIGLTLLLNKLGKHATAVYSGSTPSTIEFLEPQKTLEKNTDSLRDFIIALDKSKADKLRYKVEGDHVRIFITPYRTSISEKDLDFSQGDFNVDVVIALGVKEQHDLDQVITAHGRILHDATTIALTTGEPSSLGSINWIDATVSSLCEMISSVTDSLGPDLVDAQVATALMTGIVAETHRFSNEKTTPGAMSASAKLMAAGANQQLVASKLQEGGTGVGVAAVGVPLAAAADGSLEIDHLDNVEEAPESIGELPALDDQPQLPIEPLNIDANGDVQPPEDEPTSAIEGGSSLILEPPTLGGRLTANSDPEALDPSVDPLSGGEHDGPLLSHDAPAVTDAKEEPLPDLAGTEELPGPSMELPSESGLRTLEPLPEQPAEPAVEAVAPPVPEPFVPPAVPEEPAADAFTPKTLSDIEQAVDSPHLDVPAPQPQENALPGSDDLAQLTGQFSESGNLPTPDVDNARDAVFAAISNGDGPLPPLEAIGSQPLDLEIQQTGETGVLDHIDETTGIPEFTMPENLVPPVTDLPVDATAAPFADPAAPPPVPPPMMPPTELNNTLPELPGQDQSDPNNPFGLPPA